VDGDPGVGKTMLGCQLAANITRDYPMPDQTGKLTHRSGTPAHVLMVACEDHLGAVVRPRLRRAGADLSKVTFVLGCEDGAHVPREFTLEDLQTLTDYMEHYHPRLVYIDAIQVVLGPRVDINRANQVTAMLRPLKALAEAYDCAIVCNRHPAKEGQNSAKLLYRGLGSQAFGGSARAGLFVEESPSDPTQSLILAYKVNAGQPARTQIFSKKGGVFTWCRASRITARLLGGGAAGPSPWERTKAALWLEAYLEKGAATASSVYDTVESQDLDYSRRSLRMAAEALGVHKTPLKGDYLWTLPPLNPTTEENPTIYEISTNYGNCVNSVTVEEDSNGAKGGKDDKDDKDHTDLTVLSTGVERCPENKESQETQECQEDHIVTDDPPPAPPPVRRIRRSV
jgi:hypothetical protein